MDFDKIGPKLQGFAFKFTKEFGQCVILDFKNGQNRKEFLTLSGWMLPYNNMVLIFSVAPAYVDDI